MKDILLKKLSVEAVLKLSGTVALGVAAVMKANRTDENVQKFLKVVAEKSLEAMKKKP